MPDHIFAWFTACCQLMDKSPMFMVLLIDHKDDGSFCWLCSFHNGATPKETVHAYQHITSRKAPEDTAKLHYHLCVQTEYGRA